MSPTDLRYHTLNATATILWQLLEHGTDLAAATEQFAQRFEVDELTCRQDVQACLDHFLSIGVIEVAA